MAKTLVEKKICDACGADVRPGSLFCYNCGGAVSEKMPAADQSLKNDNHHQFQPELAEASDLKTTQLKRETVEEFENPPVAKPIGKPLGSDLFEKAEAERQAELEALAEKPTIQEKAKLKSAAHMRRKAKSFQRKVEVVWEEPENAPNKWFPIVAVVLILVVVGIYYLAMYLK